MKEQDIEKIAKRIASLTPNKAKAVAFSESNLKKMLDQKKPFSVLKLNIGTKNVPFLQRDREISTFNQSAVESYPFEKALRYVKEDMKDFPLSKDYQQAYFIQQW